MAEQSNNRKLGNKATEWVSVKSFGATGDGVTDDSAAIQAALDAHDHVYIPNGTYLVKDLSLNSFQILEFESENAIFKGVISTDDVFSTTGSLARIRIFGGTIRDCGKGWYHTGNSALASCSIHRTVFRDCTYGNDLSTAVNCIWDNVQFGTNGGADNIDYGLYFRSDGSGQTNANHIRECVFFFFKEKGITFEDSTISKGGNDISGCWFEDSTGIPIYVGGGTKQLNIHNTCYFETNGGTSKPDIKIEAVLAAINEIHIDGNEFATPNTDQTERIECIGNAYFDARDNSVTLSTGDVFATFAGAFGNHSKLFDNYLNATGAGSYESRLFTSSGSDLVSWSVSVGSGFVTEDTRPHSHLEGGESFAVYTLANDATPSVEGMKLCKTGGTTTITDFDDGRVGQTISILSEHAVTITDGAPIILNGSANFVMAAADTLTLTMFNDQIWQEVSRTVNL